MSVITRIAARLQLTRPRTSDGDELVDDFLDSVTLLAEVRAARASASAGVRAVLVAPSLWAVYDNHGSTSVALGHIDAHNDTFHVALEGEELKPHSFLTWEEGVE